MFSINLFFTYHAHFHTVTIIAKNDAGIKNEVCLGKERHFQFIGIIRNYLYYFLNATSFNR